MDFSFLCTDDVTQEFVPLCLGTQGISHTYLDTLLTGFANTTILAITALLIAIFLGIIVGTLRTLPNAPILRGFATLWVEVLRNIPLLVQIFIWYFVVPVIIPKAQSFPPFLLVIFALGFFTSARIAEQVRSGIESTPTGQRYAGMALGFTTYQTYRFVILPRAIRTIFPPLISESMGIVKNSAVAFAVSISELMRYYLQAIDDVGHNLENLFILTVLYVLLGLIIFVVMSFIERMLRVPGFQSEGQ